MVRLLAHPLISTDMWCIMVCFVAVTNKALQQTKTSFPYIDNYYVSIKVRHELNCHQQKSSVLAVMRSTLFLSLSEMCVVHPSSCCPNFLDAVELFIQTLSPNQLY